jgi:ligand-binding sensor protein
MRRIIPLRAKERDMRAANSGTGRAMGGPSAGPAVALSPTLRAELLDPAAWQEGLERYALAMRLAVALVDAEGHLLGECLNPQPLWSLLHAQPVPAQESEVSSPEPGAVACPFAVASLEQCTCVADTLRSGTVIRKQDRTGLVHFAVPLMLGEQNLGALVAGQVFDTFPDQLPLERAALRLNLAPALVWHKARLEHSVSPSLLRVYEDLLTTLGQTFLQSRYHTLRETARLAELTARTCTTSSVRT